MPYPQRSILAAVTLFFVAPLVAEYLLGDFPVTFLSPLIMLAPLYGGGALLIRELVRRSGRGWPSILLLGVAYALIEEGFARTDSLQPRYLRDAHAPSHPRLDSRSRHWRMVDTLHAQRPPLLEHWRFHRTRRRPVPVARPRAVAGQSRLMRRCRSVPRRRGRKRRLFVASRPLPRLARAVSRDCSVHRRLRRRCLSRPARVA